MHRCRRVNCTVRRTARRFLRSGLLGCRLLGRGLLGHRRFFLPGPGHVGLASPITRQSIDIHEIREVQRMGLQGSHRAQEQQAGQHHPILRHDYSIQGGSARRKLCDVVRLIARNRGSPVPPKVRARRDGVSEKSGDRIRSRPQMPAQRRTWPTASFNQGYKARCWTLFGPCAISESSPKSQLSPLITSVSTGEPHPGTRRPRH